MIKISKKNILSCFLFLTVFTACAGNDVLLNYSDLELDTVNTTASVYNQEDLIRSFAKAPSFEDKKPHDWTRLTPSNYPIHGTDVSRYQGIIDWPRVQSSGISFAFIKATEGGDHLDETFSRNWKGAHEAHIARGAYHFYYWCRSGAEQARWFIRNVPKDKMALPPVLDLEWNHQSASCKIRPSKEEIHKQVNIFLSIIEAHYKKRPIIYTTVDFFEHSNMKTMKSYPFWLRSVAGHPEEKYGSHPWIFWQYTGTGRIPGITGNADINTFYGSHEQWQQLMSPLLLNTYNN